MSGTAPATTSAQSQNSEQLAAGASLDRRHRIMGIWLLLCCAVLLALVVVGGATRLTGSGLSITEWKPMSGALPPLSAERWQQEFDLYRESPEYLEINRGMSMSEFQFIYWWEWGHRQLARFLGLIFAVPLAWFWWRGWIPPQMRWPFVGLIALGALQAWMGWYMVQSGLVDEPRVSQYRLAAHLSLALLIYAGMLWLALRLIWPVHAHPRRMAAAPWLLGLVAITIVSGAFVAGLKAGYAFGTFPLMGGQWLPPGGLYLEPAWRNLFDNPATVQFIHRLLGIATVLAAVGLWGWGWRLPLSASQRLVLHLVAAFAVLQVSLGIATLVMGVPIKLAVAHQAVAVLLLSAVLVFMHCSRNREGFGV
jgi:heme a synthase